MITGVAYQGFVILPTPRPLGDVGMWGVNPHIARSTQDGAETRQFSTDDKYATEEEAATHCVAYGKLVIDGRFLASWLDNIPYVQYLNYLNA